MHQLCKMAHERIGTYWHVFPTEEQGRKAIWEGFRKDGLRTMENVFPAAIRKSPREWTVKQEMVVELKCGSIYRILGSDKIEVVGAGPVGVIFSEYSVAKPKSWELISPMLMENDGWAAFIYTPRGSNHGKTLYDMARGNPDWFSDLQTLYDTRAYDPERTLDAERRAGKPEEYIRQEYLCDWTAANVGAVFGDLLETLEKRGGMADFEHPTDGVFTVWDLGISDATAIWFFRVNEHGVPDLIDHYEATGQPASHYFEELEARGYQYVKHWYPPTDGPARTWQTGVANVQLLKDWCGKNAAKRGSPAITPDLGLSDGIQAARWLLQQPIRFHPRCREGIDALRQYHYEWDDDRKVFSRKPDHDWSSHTADAFRYVASVVKSADAMRPKPKPARKPIVAEPLTLDKLWDTQPREKARI